MRTSRCGGRGLPRLASLASLPQPEVQASRSCPIRKDRKQSCFFGMVISFFGMVLSFFITTALTWAICTRRACKLNRARSQLYRSQILQENMRWKALAEIYTMHSFAPFWNRIPNSFAPFWNRFLSSNFCSKSALKNCKCLPEFC